MYFAFLGTTEAILLAAILLLLFGATLIPKWARSLGKVNSEFKKGGAENDLTNSNKK